MCKLFLGPLMEHVSWHDIISTPRLLISPYSGIITTIRWTRTTLQVGMISTMRWIRGDITTKMMTRVLWAIHLSLAMKVPECVNAGMCGEVIRDYDFFDAA